MWLWLVPFYSHLPFVQRRHGLQHRVPRKDGHSRRRWRRGNENYRRESRIRLLARLMLYLLRTIALMLASLTGDASDGLCMCMSDILLFTEVTMLGNRISDYPIVSQGKTRIPGVNDAAQFDVTVVSLKPAHGACGLISGPLKQNFWQTYELPAPCRVSTGFPHMFSHTGVAKPVSAQALPILN